MDKFGGLFNISAVDIGRIFDFMGLGKSTGGKSAREMENALRRQEREAVRFTKSMRQQMKAMGKSNPELQKRMAEIQSQMADSYRKAKKEYEQNALREQLSKTGIMGKMVDTISDLRAGGVLDKLTTFLLGKGVVTAVGGVTAILASNFQAINDIIDETGFFADRVLGNYIELRKEMTHLNQLGHDFSVTTQTHLRLSTELRATFGEIGRTSVRTLDDIANLQYTMGVANNEVLEMLNTFRGITGATVETNLELLQATAILASRENIPFRAIMEDISGNADMFAKNMGQGTDEMLKTSVFARRLGIEMSTVSSMISGMTDLESVIDSSMRLSLITGKEINFLASANEAFWGRTENATRMILDELAKVDDLTFNIPFVRENFADQLGVSTTELVKMRQAIHAVGTEATLVDFGFTEEISNFNDLMAGVGFRKLRIEAQRNIIRPLSSAFDKHVHQVDNLIGKVTGVIESIGSAIEWYFDTLGVAGAILPAFVAGVGKIAQSNVTTQIIAGQQLMEQKKTNALLSAKFLGGNVGAVAGRGMGRGLKTAGALGIGAMGVGMGTAMSHSGVKDDDGMLQALGVLSGIGSGAIAGGMMGGPKGALIGAILGGLTSASPMLFGTGQAQGGIVTKPLMTPIAENARKGQREAVIPLDSKQGKDMMQLDLSDSSINKLVARMKEGGMAPKISFSYNGENIDSSEEFFKMVAGTA